jgi:membrane associated rhomboid family serine protease
MYRKIWRVLAERIPVYRLMSAPWFHYGVLHILFNMLSVIAIGPPLERRIGTLAFFWIVSPKFLYPVQHQNGF